MMPGQLFECNLEDKVTTRSGTDTPDTSSGNDSFSKYNWTSGLTPHEQLERQAEFCASTQDEP